MSKRRVLFIAVFIIIFFISIICSIYYYKKRYTVKFETGTNEIILNQHLLNGEKVKKPDDPKKDGYIFIGWENNGQIYNFEKKVDNDLVLSAKWIKEDYIKINFITNTLYEIDNVKLLKGNKIEELPSVQKEGYNFLGWYINDEKYIDKELYSDTTLEAKFEPLKEELKIGDTVYIVGPYSSSYDKTDYNTMAIGWDRVVLDIIENSENPYVVGNENGVTGFFKEQSLNKLKNQVGS